ncbi:uncharacterized protein [Parasteatoda tepidariorum]|uniref:uncharacterized protein n=1 Tax=Parasteatoda tepidariorum TaxID=114398 RepID=UPI00077FBA3D|nr:uncharacterized protein LOC107448555 [Parasteatoda tepidariorum]
MEEVYVIRLRGVPSTSTSESSSAVDTNDLIRGSVLGLGVLHCIFGILVLIFGALKTTLEHEPPATVFGTLFGPVFVATGLSAIMSWKRPFRKLKIKVFFGFSVISLLSSATFLGFCLLGVVYFHSVPRVFGEGAHVTANAIISALGEMIVAALSVLTAGSAVWKCLQCGAFRPANLQQQSTRQKVIVKTDIVGGQSAAEMQGALHEEMVRHVSPHCIISLRATDEQRNVIKKVQEYLHSQDELSFTFSDPSTLHDEQDLGVDSQNWRNDVMSVSSNNGIQNIEQNDQNTDNICQNCANNDQIRDQSIQNKDKTVQKTDTLPDDSIPL